MPRVGLTGGPSPLLRAVRFSEALGGRAEIWLKREDLLPVAFGGNKLRNLEFLVGAALAEGAGSLVTSGRRWSNHCRLTAAAGAIAGLDVHIVLSGPPGGPEHPNERLSRRLGASLHVAATADRADREALVSRVTDQLTASGRRFFVIGVGGTGSGRGDVVGACGQVVAGMELARQAGAMGLEVGTVVLPTATGGTHAGVLTGLRAAGCDARVLGVVVAAAVDDARATVARIVRDLAPLAGLDAVAPADIELDGTQLGAGYGVPTAAAEEAADLLATTEGVFVDPIYTAKALAGLVAGVRDGRLTGTIVFWHAGGLPALFG